MKKQEEAKLARPRPMGERGAFVADHVAGAPIVFA
jgi:hypothetical protein